jgi:S-DNA-T family DNA segregation ATPase FtsK/SpoIIIE
MLDGQRIGDYQPVADRMNTTIKGLGATVFPVPEKHSKRLRIEVLARDPLIENARIPQRPAISNPLPRIGVDVATTDAGEAYLLRLLGQNTLIASESGMGKGGAFWSIMDAHHPAMEAGLVKFWGIDNKGQEFEMGKHLFDRCVIGGTARDACHMVEDTVDFMRDRQKRVGERFLTPTVDEFLLGLGIDELAALSAWVTDYKLRRRIADAMSLLLSQDRSCCIALLGMLQDPSKETLPQRGLYQNVIAGRIPGSLVGGVFKDKDAYLKGAKCPDIPRSTPGVFYAEAERRPGYPRIRFRYREDEEIQMWEPVAPIAVEPPKRKELRRVPRFGGFDAD